MIRENKLFGSLFGKAIADIRINKECDIVMFVTRCGENHYYFAEADCCSDSWFEGFTDVKGLVNTTPPKQIIDAMVTACNCKHSSTKQEFDKIQHIIFSTTCLYSEKGIEMEIVMNLRNSSNGYYNGSISYLGESLEKCHWAKNKPERIKFKSIL